MIQPPPLKFGGWLWACCIYIQQSCTYIHVIICTLLWLGLTAIASTDLAWPLQVCKWTTCSGIHVHIFLCVDCHAESIVRHVHHAHRLVDHLGGWGSEFPEMNVLVLRGTQKQTLIWGLILWRENTTHKTHKQAHATNVCITELNIPIQQICTTELNIPMQTWTWLQYVD